ncbi:MAG: hypothetical protein F4X84_00875 [Synechococcus sp. SB0662_bin_45]|nr:hypothetical protein [Synechococcus sp. SB0662_bin_45]
MVKIVYAFLPRRLLHALLNEKQYTPPPHRAVARLLAGEVLLTVHFRGKGLILTMGNAPGERPSAEGSAHRAGDKSRCYCHAMIQTARSVSAAAHKP